jgi:hypothetical protein
VGTIGLVKEIKKRRVWSQFETEARNKKKKEW